MDLGTIIALINGISEQVSAKYESIGIQSQVFVEPNIFRNTLKDGTIIDVPIENFNNFTLEEKALLDRFSYLNNQLLFDGKPISSGSTVDLSNYALKNGNINEDFSANNLTVKGNIMPTGNGTQNIGSPDNRFGKIYVNEAMLSTNTLYLGDTPVMGTNQDTIVIKGDKDQSIAVKTTGIGTTNLISEGNVTLSTSGMNANVNVQATGSGANANLGATNEINLIAPNVNIKGATDITGYIAMDNLTVRGNLTVNGGTTTVNSTTVQVADNIMELNKNEVGYGVTAGKSGIKIDRGDADAMLMVFDETDKNFKIGTDSSLQSIATQNYVDNKIPVIQNNSTTYPQRKNIKFTSNNVTISDDSLNNVTLIDITSGGSSFLNVKNFGMTIADGGNKAIISFTNPTSSSIDKIYLYVSYLEDLSNQSYSYVSTNATLLSNNFITTSDTNNTYELAINDTNRNKNCYIKVFVGYGGTDYSSGSSINQKLADITPTSVVTNISITQLSKDSIKLTWSNPVESDLKSINIIQKYDSVPTDIYDGTIVYTGKDTTCTLTGLDIGKHVYYRFYTLDTSDNIQSNLSQVTDVQLDNIPPNEATNFSILNSFSICKLKFSDSTSADWKMTKIIRKVGNEPISIDDGTLILTNTTRDAYKNAYFIDGGLSNGLNYYYKIYSIDSFGNISDGVSQVGSPVATALPEVSNFKIENIENGTKQKLSWTNPFAPTGLTYVERQLFYTTNQSVTIDSMTRDQCLNDSNIVSLSLGSGTGQGTNDSFTTSTSLTIGDISRYKVFIHFDSSGSAIWNSGTYDIKQVKDETPCLDYTNISALGYDSMGRLEYTDPIDSDWSKTLIILSKGGYVLDENSTSTNIIQKITSNIRNQYSMNPLEFDNLTNGNQYYISLFSYDTSNNVNRNIINRALFTTNAIIVNNPTSFIANSDSNGNKIILSWINSSSNYTSREIYYSTIDISNFTREQCVSGATLLNNGVGNGANASETYNHINVTYNTTYYYKIFTKYTYNNIDYYSSGASNSAIPVDTQPPLDLTSFNVLAKDSEIDLSWNFNSSDTDIQKVVIVRNTTGYSTNESDGIVIVNSNITSFNDTGLINGTTYYYRAFIHDIHGNINTNNTNTVTGIPQSVKKYGVNWNKSTDVVTRLGDSIGLTATVSGINNFNNLTPWKNMRRCNLSDTGIVNAYYGDVTYKTDGTNGMCMVEIPKFYYKVNYVDSNNIEFWIADNPTEGFELHPAFYRDRTHLCDDTTGTATEVNYRYHHTYLPYYNNSSGKLESKSSVTPTVSISTTTARGYAKARGNGWSLLDYNLRYAVQLLYLIEYANFNSQSVIGQGYTNNASIRSTGGTNSYGNLTYGESTGTYQMCYRGIEDVYGNCRYICDGILFDSNYNILTNNKGFNNSGVGYTSYPSGISANFSGFGTDIISNKLLGFIPKTGGGSNSTKLTDYCNLYFDINRTFMVGGTYNDGLNTGIFACNSTSNSGATYLSASLAY